MIARDEDLFIAKKMFVQCAIERVSILTQALETAEEIEFYCIKTILLRQINEEYDRIRRWNKKGFLEKESLRAREYTSDIFLPDNFLSESDSIAFLESERQYNNSKNALNDQNEALSFFCFVCLMSLPIITFWVAILSVFFVSIATTTTIMMTSLGLFAPLIFFLLMTESIWPNLLYDEVDEVMSDNALSEQLKDLSFFNQYEPDHRRPNRNQAHRLLTDEELAQERAARRESRERRRQRQRDIDREEPEDEVISASMMDID
ncbi:MAG: hypothetical protein P1U61_07225 [Legionellaceae bacterium]|nr:hypothetical protein [Legionellaceae bacterium]